MNPSVAAVNATSTDVLEPARGIDRTLERFAPRARRGQDAGAFVDYRPAMTAAVVSGRDRRPGHRGRVRA